VVERFPEINFVVADVGGVIAFFGKRATNIYTGRTEEIRKRYGLKENPLESLKKFYVDTADHPPLTLKCVLEFFGSERMVLGKNYPYGPEEGCLFIKSCLKAVDELGLPGGGKNDILGVNAAKILGI
jgi:aminocarboxymuconate-semialdehyde decarboxylase